MKIFVGPDGNTRGVRSELTQKLGLPHSRRASHVEPVNRILRLGFYLIRNRVKDNSRWARFTRTWPCRWQARIKGGPVLGPYRNRNLAIDAEIKYLNVRMKEEMEL